MTHDNRGWNDDEETIVNFPRKAPAPSSAQSSDSVPTERFGPPQPAAAQAAVEIQGNTSDVNTLQPSALTGLETPPSSGMYGSEPSSTNPAYDVGPPSVPAQAVSTRGQDPYLAASGVPDSLPTEDQSVLLPFLPPLPPSVPFPGTLHQARDTQDYDAPGMSTFDIPQPDDGRLPGFVPLERETIVPEPSPEQSSDAAQVTPADASVGSDSAPWWQTNVALDHSHETSSLPELPDAQLPDPSADFVETRSAQEDHSPTDAGASTAYTFAAADEYRADSVKARSDDDTANHFQTDAETTVPGPGAASAPSGAWAPSGRPVTDLPSPDAGYILREPASTIITDMAPSDAMSEVPDMTPRHDIDPPTIMDVPIVAQRELETMHPHWMQADERAQSAEGQGVPADHAAPSASSNAMPVQEVEPTAGRVAADPAEVQDAIRDRLEKDRLAGLDQQSVADQEWAALCEAVVATGGLPPVLRPPSLHVVRDAGAEAAEPSGTTMAADEELESAGRADGPVGQAADASSGTSDPVRTPVTPDIAAHHDQAVDTSPADLYEPEPAPPALESRPESDMEKTNLHLKARPVDTVAELAWLAILQSPTAHIHQMYRLDSLRMELGRAFDAPLFVDDKTVSSRHAAIRYERVNDRFEFVLYDLASTNGTYVNSAPVHMAVLKDDDRIRVGETELVFKKVGEPSPATQ